MQTIDLISGIAGQRAAKRAAVVLQDRQLADITADDFRACGIAESAVRRIGAAIELAHRVSEETLRYDPGQRITSPSDALRYCRGAFLELLSAKREELWIVSLDTKNVPIRRHQISIGTNRNSLIHPREVFRPAIADSANAVIVVHNHPSGDSTPSDQDVDVTRRLHVCGETLGIPVIDHIVVARDGGTSIQEFIGR